MKILNKIIEEKSKKKDKVNAIEKINKFTYLIIFEDTSSIIVGYNKKDDTYTVKSVNKYNDDENQSVDFMDELDDYINDDMKSEYLESLIK